MPYRFSPGLCPQCNEPPTGTVERARTGEKQRFDGVEAVSEIIARMLRDDGPSVVESPGPVAPQRWTGPATQ